MVSQGHDYYSAAAVAVDNSHLAVFDTTPLDSVVAAADVDDVDYDCRQ